MVRGSQISRIFALIAPLLLSACGARVLHVNDQCDCGFYTTDGGQMLHWNDGAQLVFEFHSSVPASARPSISAAMDVYNETLANTHLAVLDATASPAPDYDFGEAKQDGVNGIYWVNGDWPWEKSNPGSDAMTVVTFRENQVVEADLFFRAKSFATQNTDAMSTAEDTDLLQSLRAMGKSTSSAGTTLAEVFVIAVHELGHSIGRVHSKHDESIMFPAVGLGFLRNPIGSYDRGILSSVYKLKPAS